MNQTTQKNTKLECSSWSWSPRCQPEWSWRKHCPGYGSCVAYTGGRVVADKIDPLATNETSLVIPLRWPHYLLGKRRPGKRYACVVFFDPKNIECFGSDHRNETDAPRRAHMRHICGGDIRPGGSFTNQGKCDSNFKIALHLIIIVSLAAVVALFSED